MTIPITCGDARELMLEAEPGDLHPESISPLGSHLRTCAACTADAARIRAANASLEGALEALVANPRPAAPVAVVRQRRRGIVRIAVPLAAAAALLLVVLEERTQTMLPILLPVEQVPDAPVVNATGDGAVAVMRTSNPNITIVWQLEEAQ
jgi:anti-sigma factor RsiW